MVFLKVCLIYKGWKVYCHLESTARQPWRVRQQLRTAALALCLLHVFKLPCLNPAFCSSRNALAALACRREAATPPPPHTPEAQASLIRLSTPPRPAPDSRLTFPWLWEFPADLAPRWPPHPTPQSSAGPPPCPLKW